MVWASSVAIRDKSLGRRSRLRWMALLLPWALLVGCGQKGPLYLNPPDAAAGTQAGKLPPAPAPASASASASAPKL